ncbi:MAG: hypothetical protein KA792_00305 [Bacteroidales bacterium]|nr:hypothetical protein [Bacteroidales bacterium]
MLINRIIKAMEEIMSIKKLVEDNIKNNKKILEQLHKSMLFIEFNKTYFDKFLQQGDLTRQDLFAFYNADDINDKFKLIEKEIKDLD